MFKLQRLEITGFKSFADHTNLIFTGDGVTGIVGPNGCGKSNVAEAIAWVLGEQRVKHLRSAEMKDVIFQGSRNRPPCGMAEVVLHLVRDETIPHEPGIEDIDSTLEELDDQTMRFDEIEASDPASEAVEEMTPSAAESEAPETASASASAGPASSNGPAPPAREIQNPASMTHRQAHRHWRRRNFALEFAPGEAVAVTRRLYRSGESEYLLNDRPCRLRDIQDLFSGTGLSGGHYAIIEQGRIGQVLSAKPMDRRIMIEEAAGITKFRVRQRAAEARLESARANLSRLSDIISEIERQVNSLRRQASKARRHRILREELRQLQSRVYVAEERSLTALLEQTQADLDAAAREEQWLAADLAQSEQANRAATQRARALEDELTQVRAAVADAALERDRSIRERSYREDQITSLEKRRAEAEQEIEDLGTRLLAITAELDRLQELDAKLSAENRESTLSLGAAKEAHDRKRAEVTKAEGQLEGARAELLSHTAACERLGETARQLENDLEKLDQQAEGLAREGERAAKAHADALTEAAKLQQECAAARARLAQLVEERQAAVKAVVEGHEKVSDTDADLSRVRDEYSRTQHRLDSLKELDERRAHYSLAVQEAFAVNETEDLHLLGTLAEAIKVDARWERAVEGAFGAALQSILVPTPDDALRVAVWLKENQMGRATFLVTGLHGASGEAEVATVGTLNRVGIAVLPYVPVGIDGPRLGDILQAPRELLAVLERALPEKLNARIVGTLDDAIGLSLATGDMFVTIEGDWVTGGQLVNAGNGRALEEGAGLLAFRRELSELATRAEEQAAEVEAAAAIVREARSRMSGLEESVVLLNDVIAREERDAMARDFEAANLKQEIERAERHLRVIASDTQRLSEERRDLAERRVKALFQAQAAEGALCAARERIQQAATVLESMRREAESQGETLSQQRTQAATAELRSRAIASDLQRGQAEREEITARLARYKGEVSEAGDRIEQLRHSITEIDRVAANVDEQKAQEEKQIGDARARLNEARDRSDNLAAELAELNKSAAGARDKRGAIEVQRAEALARLNFVRESCATELNQTLEDLARDFPADPEFELEAGRARLEELRARLEGFGAVNMMALDELSESEERLAFLTGQRDDIRQGIASTEEALREIKRRSRERFREAFESVNQHFGVLFRKLFGGGRGEMSLIDTEDELESGIEIVAQPPGKRLQNLLLLSGGEKALAALALVLGIFHYRPAPFCCLDEVDAPLDEANIGRFTTKVVEMAANTQFIVITHNKRTMETARALYGVTMEEAGVSKLVSVRFE